MKVYISLPISGCDMRTVRARAESAKKMLADAGHTPVSPLDVSGNENAPYHEHIGKDISALLRCDAIYLLHGWVSSKGCTLEYEAAKIYDKILMYE